MTYFYMTNSRAQFLDKRKKEQYHKTARGNKLRARSYFKLQQIDRKFDIIHNNQHIIDLGCAPGGWLQYLDEKIENGKIIGIDLLPIKRQSEFSKNIEIIEDDFNNIEDYVDEEFDLVLSDMAPEFSGSSAVDRGRTHKLNLITLDFCKKHLRVGGNLAFKTFEGEDLLMVKSKAKKMFDTVKEYKPHSSQKKSAETFIVCFCKR